MQEKALTPWRIAFENLKQGRGRSIGLIVLVAVLTFAISGGALLGFSLTNGIDQTKLRLGADLIVVPRGAESHLQGALLQGEPSTFYMPEDVAVKLLAEPDAEKASAQFFLASFDSSHCSSRVQIVAYDPDTDFIVAPWFQDRGMANPGAGESVVGNGIDYPEGSIVLLFGTRYTVSGNLEKTGMGFDSTMFITRDTAKQMITDFEVYAGEGELPDENAVSAVLYKLKDGVDPNAFAKHLRNDYSGISIVQPQQIISDLSKNLGLTIAVLRVLLIGLWIVSALMLSFVFSLMLNERKREFGILRAVGASRKTLSHIVVGESVLISTIGAAVGIALISLVVFPFNALIESKFEAEYLLPSGPLLALILVVSFLVCSVIGLVSSAYAASKFGRTETFTIIREGA
jgi:putative ABC transport system permease protein